MSSKKLISDQVLYKLAGGIPDGSFPIDERDVWKALEQKINTLFKVRHFETLQSGETIPDNAMIATYEDVAVVSSSNGSKSYATLPVIPISLPKNVGIFLVYDPNYPDMPFIPLQRGFTALLRTDKLLSDVMGQITYESKSSIINFNSDITLLGIDVVTMELCIMDISQYSITDRLPIPADFEDILITQLVEDFAKVTPELGLVNNFSNANQKANP